MPILWEDTVRDANLLTPCDQADLEHEDGNAIFGVAVGVACTTLLITLVWVGVYLFRVG
jgi:hypothetical protein